jgi:iron complex outermembrane receptor protein
MSLRQLVTIVGAAAVLASSIPRVSAATSTDQTDRASATNELHEVVVTATKRDARLQEIPIAVSALSSADLRNLNAVGLEDYARSVPSISLTDLGTGNQRVAIRGINPTSGVTSVKEYLGETPLPETRGNYGRGVLNPQLVDLDRIEVLRGPQGTLYGAGSVGGTIRLVPKDPDTSQWSGYVESSGTTTKHGGQGIDATAVLNAPVVNDVAGVRAATWYEHDDGFISRVFPGGSKDVPGTDVWGARAIATAKVSESLKISGMILHESRHYGGIQDITGGALNPGNNLVQVTLADTPERIDLQSTIYNLTAKLTQGSFELTSSSSYVDMHRDFDEEGTQLVSTFFGGPPFSNPFREDSVQHEFTQEIRVNTTKRIDGFDFIFGVFYDKVGETGFQRDLPKGFSQAFFPIPDDNLFSSDSTSFSRETSFFGELSYALTDAWTATVGARRYDIKNGGHISFNGLFNNFMTTINDVSSHSVGEVYKANLSYHPTPDYLVYAQYAGGFRPGTGFTSVPDVCKADLAALGFTSTPTQINPDTVKNYELGAKTT